MREGRQEAGGAMQACRHLELHGGSAQLCPVCSVEGLETKESGGLIPALGDPHL